MMRYFAFALTVLVMCSISPVTFAQRSSRPDFSGVWEMESAGRGSQDLSQKHVVITGPTSDLTQITLTIADDGNNIKVRRVFTLGDETQEQSLEYHTDGRGEENPTIGSRKRTFQTGTRWRQGRLVIRFDPFPVSSSGRPLVAYRQIEWRVEDGGKKLVETDSTHYQESQTIDSSVSAADLRQFSIVPPRITVRRVYKKVS